MQRSLSAMGRIERERERLSIAGRPKLQRVHLFRGLFSESECEWLLHEVCVAAAHFGWQHARHKHYATEDLPLWRAPQAAAWVVEKMRAVIGPLMARCFDVAESDIRLQVRHLAHHCETCRACTFGCFAHIFMIILGVPLEHPCFFACVLSLIYPCVSQECFGVRYEPSGQAELVRMRSLAQACAHSVHLTNVRALLFMLNSPYIEMARCFRLTCSLTARPILKEEVLASTRLQSWSSGHRAPI